MSFLFPLCMGSKFTEILEFDNVICTYTDSQRSTPSRTTAFGIFESFDVDQTVNFSHNSKESSPIGKEADSI